MKNMLSSRNIMLGSVTFAPAAAVQKVGADVSLHVGGGRYAEWVTLNVLCTGRTGTSILGNPKLLTYDRSHLTASESVTFPFCLVAPGDTSLVTGFALGNSVNADAMVMPCRVYGMPLNAAMIGVYINPDNFSGTNATITYSVFYTFWG